jgi:membrane protease YdiL (CAAX protease family)
MGSASVPKWQLRLAAVCEVIGIVFASIFLQRLVLGALGLERWKVVQQEMIESGESDFLLLARLAAQDQLLRYGLLFALAFVIGWWHRRRRREQYGLTLNKQAPGKLVVMGVVLFAGAGFLPATLQFAARWLPIGKGPEHWGLFPDTLTWEFLVYMAVGSFLLVPLVEELAARGYIQIRLIEDFGPAGGILITAFFFTIAHTQYFKLEILSLGMVVSLALGSLLMGYVFFRTGSLLPTVVAHALVNFPLPNSALVEGLQLAVMAVILVLARRWIASGWPAFRQTLRGAREVKLPILAAAALVTLVLAFGLSNQTLAIALVPLLLLVALIIEARDRRSRQAT